MSGLARFRSRARRNQREDPPNEESLSERLHRRRSRRSILTAAGAGVAGLAGHALLATQPALAADGDPLVLGQGNSASTSTSLSAELPGTSSSVVEVENTGLSGTAIQATARNDGGLGIRSEAATGIVGTSFAASGVGVLGENATGDIFGRGVEGIASNGWGVYAVSANGQALRVDGRAAFSRTGLVTITFPAKTATVNVPGPISASSSFPERPSIAFASVQGILANTFVIGTALNAAAGTLTIYLSRAPGTAAQPKSVVVGWMVVN